MNREWLSKAFGDMDERYVLEAYRPVPEDVSGASEKIVHMKKKRIITIALAAALTLVLGIAAYAAWSIHEARQQELRADLKIDENNVSSYVEYDVSDEQTGGLVLLSSVSDGKEQRIYLNISPVSEEEAASYSEEDPYPVYTLEIEGSVIGGGAYPVLAAGRSISGAQEMNAAVLEHAYDKETQTLTLQGFLDVSSVKQAMANCGTDTVSLSVRLITGTNTSRSFGPIPFTLTEKQQRVFDFGHALYHDEDLNKDIEIVGLELTPFSAMWKVHYEGDAALHTPGAEWEDCEPWCILEETVCINTKLVFSDGTEFSTGGALTGIYENGAVHLWCEWQGAVDINDVQRIVIGDQVLWDAEAESAG